LAAQIGIAVAERKAAANDRPTMLVNILITNWRHKRRRFNRFCAKLVGSLAEKTNYRK
jgi:predicted amidophosphoribosyltransferase